MYADETGQAITHHVAIWPHPGPLTEWDTNLVVDVDLHGCGELKRDGVRIADRRLGPSGIDAAVDVYRQRRPLLRVV